MSPALAAELFTIAPLGKPLGVHLPSLFYNQRYWQLPSAPRKRYRERRKREGKKEKKENKEEGKGGIEEREREKGEIRKEGRKEGRKKTLLWTFSLRLNIIQ